MFKMSKYSVLWVDDDLFSATLNENKEHLENIKNKISEKIRKYIDINWVCKQNPEAGIVELNDDNDFRLVIVDYEYKNTEYDIERIVREIEKKNIPYIIYTNFKSSVKDLICNNNLLLDVFEKHVNDELFINRIVNFFEAPPFRVLHLSDFHYASYRKEDKRYEEQISLFDSLVKVVKEEHNNSPFDCIVITGDFVSSNQWKEFIDVKKYIDQIINSTITYENIHKLFLVPGNHDIYWDDFTEGYISERAMSPFLEFYKKVYSTRLSVLSELILWDNIQNDINDYSSIKKVIWNRKLYDPLVDFIGLPTPSKNVYMKGKGEFTKEEEKFIADCWEENRRPGVVRIALMHHNIFSSLSINLNDEKDSLYRAGDALYTLLKYNCQIVLTGHTHSAGVLTCKASNLCVDGYDNPKQILIVSSGTVGGYHPSGDRYRSFNIIDIYDAQRITEKRKVSIKPYIYESSFHKWKERKNNICDMIIE